MKAATPIWSLDVLNDLAQVRGAATVYRLTAEAAVGAAIDTAHAASHDPLSARRLRDLEDLGHG
jgi:hypothetical protein